MINEAVQQAAVFGSVLAIVLVSIRAAYIIGETRGAEKQREKDHKVLWDSWMDYKEKCQEMFDREKEIGRLMHAIKELGGDPVKYKRGD